MKFSVKDVDARGRTRPTKGGPYMPKLPLSEWQYIKSELNELQQFREGMFKTISPEEMDAIYRKAVRGMLNRFSVDEFVHIERLTNAFNEELDKAKSEIKSGVV